MHAYTHTHTDPPRGEEQFETRDRQRDVWESAVSPLWEWDLSGAVSVFDGGREEEGVIWMYCCQIWMFLLCYVLFDWLFWYKVCCQLLDSDFPHRVYDLSLAPETFSMCFTIMEASNPVLHHPHPPSSPSIHLRLLLLNISLTANIDLTSSHSPPSPNPLFHT